MIIKRAHNEGLANEKLKNLSPGKYPWAPLPPSRTTFKLLPTALSMFSVFVNQLLYLLC